MARKGKKPPVVDADEAQFYTCPAGHRLPHKTNAGQCSPIHCAGVAKSQRRKIEAKKQVEVGLAPSQEAALASIELAEDEERATKAQKRYQMRKRYLNAPEKLNGAAAEEWADQKLVELLPEAVVDIEWDLKYGNDSERQAARKQVLDATGRGKREGGGGGTQPIIMLVGQGVGPGAQPWLQRVEVKKVGSGEGGEGK